MIDKSYLQDLLPILKLHGVKCLKTQGLEIQFYVEHKKAQDISASGLTSSLDSDNSTQIIADTLKKQEEAMPPDLRADALMDQDKILNWSSPDQKAFEEEPELPLTGEQPL